MVLNCITKRWRKEKSRCTAATIRTAWCWRHGAARVIHHGDTEDTKKNFMRTVVLSLTKDA